MFRVRLVSLFMLIATLFSTLSVSAQKPVQSPQVQSNVTVAGDENWDDRFGLAFDLRGDAMIYAMVEFRGELYVAGNFRFSDESQLNMIARWNGRRWAAVGNLDWAGNPNGSPFIYALFVHDDQLYITGTFTQAGGVSANNIARWDGSQWYALGNGINGVGLDLDWYNNELYVAGTFTQAGNASVNNIARWNGTVWNDVAGGVTGMNQGFLSGRTLTSTDDNLYVGGVFTHAGNAPAANIARWDGTAWSSLGLGFDGAVEATAWYKNQLYAGGFISNTLHQNLWRWDGINWSIFTTTPITHAISSLQVITNTLYIGGAPTGEHQPALFQWDGTQSSLVKQFVYKFPTTPSYGWFEAIASYHDELYVAGSFEDPDLLPYPSRGLSRLHNGRWQSVGSGINNRGGTLMIFEGELFTRVGYYRYSFNETFYSLQRFDGSTWYHEPITNTGVTDSVIYSDSLYVATCDDNGTESNILRRTEGNWQIIASADGCIKELASSDANLYVAGYFTQINGISANKFARWNGVQWQSFSNVGIEFNPPKELTTYGDFLYVILDNRIKQWNGSQWQTLAGMESAVYALAVDSQGRLYMGGRFNQIFFKGGTLYANNIAYYDNGWFALGTGVNGDVRELATDDTTLYVGGSFSQVGQISASNIAMFKNNTWTGMGSGLTNLPYSGSVVGVSQMVVDTNHDLYVTGNFLSAGGKPSHNIAIWHPNGIPNTNPVAVADFVTTVRNQAINIAVLTNDYDLDGDMLALASLTQPAHGTAVISGTNVIYTPTVNYTGTDSFTYTISDGRGGTSSANVTIMITKSLNHAPTAVNDGAVTAFQTPVTIAVLSNDTDLDADTLSITSVTQPMHGTAVISGTSVVYTPAHGYIGNDSFSYTISDGHGGTSTAMVMLLVDGSPQYRVYLPMITR